MISVSRKYEIQGEKGIDLVTGLGFRGLFINRSCGAEVPRSSEVPELNGRLPNGATVWSSTIRRLAITPMDSLMLIIIRHVRSEGDSSRSLGPTWECIGHIRPSTTWLCQSRRVWQLVHKWVFVNLTCRRYCVRVYSPGTATESIFLSLLRTFLQPQTQHQKLSVLPSLSLSPSSDTTSAKREVLLQPALDLIARHSPRLDAFATLDVLPPLITAQDVRQFLVEVLRIPTFDTMIQREIWKSRKQTVSEQLSLLESRRVKVTDSRMSVIDWYCLVKRWADDASYRCPNCQKRLGNTVIAVHLPRFALLEVFFSYWRCCVCRGDVTHYHCREAYGEKLKIASKHRLEPKPVRWCSLRRHVSCPLQLLSMFHSITHVPK